MKKDQSMPIFNSDFFTNYRTVAADSAGRPWLIDPKKGTVTPVKVKDEN